MNLYNLHSHNGDYTITKFDSDLNVESTYTISPEGCTCPQGHKPTCRHRKMLPSFIMSGHIDDEWFLCFETGAWHTFGPQEPASEASLGMVGFDVPISEGKAAIVFREGRMGIVLDRPAREPFVSGLPLRRRI